MSSASASPCFHCGLPVPPGTSFSVSWEGVTHSLCCRGCEAVARAVAGSGLGDYYRFRTARALTGHELAAEVLCEFEVYDHPTVQRSFVRGVGEEREAALILEGITCAACVWLNEQQLKRLPGVHEVQVNYSTRRARVVWDNARVHLSDILRSIRAIGYRAHPYDPTRSQQALARERRTLLRRLGVAAIMGAQVMTLSVALYVGDWSGSDPALRTFFYWVSLLLTLPVLLYSAQPFFRTAWNDLRHTRAGMDVPVALGLGGAFVASLWTTVTGVGTVYYDSVTMFTFFLLGGRYFELGARARAAESAESLVHAAPAITARINADGLAEQTPVAELQVADTVLVRPGESVPADGVVLEGGSSVNESLLTGESLPLAKAPGDAVIGGSINIESPLIVRVEKTGPDTVLSAVLRLLDRAQAEKPRLAQLADRVAARFVIGVLVLAALVGLYWWHHEATRALPIVIAVLVVTCPCALGLATPTALTAASGALMRRGLLTTRGHALETLAHATHFVFDKTGTLTKGKLHVTHVEPFAELADGYCLTLAAALEQYSEHPIARAILAAAGREIPRVAQITNSPGEGLCGVIEGETLYLGTPTFVARRTGFALETTMLAELHQGGGTVVALASQEKILAAIVLEDTLRFGAAVLMAELKRLGKHILLLSGDHARAAWHVARALGIEEVHTELKPDDKLTHLRRLQAEGAVVAMVGDGVNDAPVLAAAQVSIAMGGASHVAAASADMILLSQDLRQLTTGVRTARRTLRIIRQNLAWAIAYNLLAVPAAAAGFVTPWMAALGMSASSLLVVANALRLVKP